MTLELTKGSVDTFYIDLLDENSVGENLTVADQARFVIKDGFSSGVNILSLSTASGITIDKPNNRLVCTLTQPLADALVAGTYIGEAAVRFTSVWRHTEPFTVKILAALAPNAQ